MNEKQRIKNCIQFRETDRVPWQINYTTESAGKIINSLKFKELNHRVLGKNIFKYNPLDDYFGNHITNLRNRAVNSVKEVEPGIWSDEWGVLWDRRIDRDIGTPVNCLLDSMDLNQLKFPDPDDPSRYLHFNPAIEAGPHRYILVKFSYSLFERAWSLRGMENLMVDFIQNPSFVHELFNKITDFNLKIIDNLINFPVNGIYFGDDWGGQRGLLMSPGTWRAFIRPYLQKMYGRAHDKGYDVFIHSCGNITVILDDLIEIGVDVFNPFQPEAIDVEGIIEKYSGKLAFYGGLSIQKTLPFGKPEDVRKEVDSRLKLAGKFRGLILSPSHDMPPDIPMDNILAMLETIKNQ